jgi:uncharacterized membrane protein YphA (DoxX/SURF4 family)
MHESRARSIAYWVTTSLAGLNFLIAGTAYLLGVQVVRDAVHELGYPAYLVPMLGACKVLAGLALLAPRLPRLKEWAYAGIAFNLVAAAASHAAVDHPANKVGAPLLVLAAALTSWSLRPSSRRFERRPEHANDGDERRPQRSIGMQPESIEPSGS